MICGCGEICMWEEYIQRLDWRSGWICSVCGTLYDENEYLVNAGDSDLEY